MTRFFLTGLFEVNLSLQFGAVIHLLLSFIGAVFGFESINGYTCQTAASVFFGLVCMTMISDFRSGMCDIKERTLTRYILKIAALSGGFTVSMYFFQHHLQPLHLPAWWIVVGGLFLPLVYGRILAAFLRPFERQMFHYRLNAMSEYLRQVQESELEDGEKAAHIWRLLRYLKIIVFTLFKNEESRLFRVRTSKVGHGVLRDKKAITKDPEKAIESMRSMIDWSLDMVS